MQRIYISKLLNENLTTQEKKLTDQLYSALSDQDISTNEILLTLSKYTSQAVKKPNLLKSMFQVAKYFLSDSDTHFGKGDIETESYKSIDKVLVEFIKTENVAGFKLYIDFLKRFHFPLKTFIQATAVNVSVGDITHIKIFNDKINLSFAMLQSANFKIYMDVMDSAATLSLEKLIYLNAIYHFGSKNVSIEALRQCISHYLTTKKLH